MKVSAPTLLSFNGGFVDTSGSGLVRGACNRQPRCLWRFACPRRFRSAGEAPRFACLLSGHHSRAAFALSADVLANADLRDPNCPETDSWSPQPHWRSRTAAWAPSERILWLNMFAVIIPPIVSFASFSALGQTLRGFQRSVHRWSKVRP
jgi:hypothetical protein